MQNLMYRYSGVGRIIDPRYPTNLAILVWGTLGAVILFFIRLAGGTGLTEAGLDAFVGALAIGLTWVLARELDPEQPLAAFVPPALMSVALVVLDQPFNLILLVYLIPLLRIVNRTVGLPATPIDSVLMVIFTGIIGVVQGWPIMLLGTAAFLLDAVLIDGTRRQLAFSMVTVLLAGGVALTGNTQWVAGLPDGLYVLAIMGVTVAFMPVILKVRYLTVTGDVTNESLNTGRVRAGQLLLLGAGYLVALWQGNSGVLELLPLWMAIAGVSLYALVRTVIPRNPVSGAVGRR